MANVFWIEGKILFSSSKSFKSNQNIVELNIKYLLRLELTKHLIFSRKTMLQMPCEQLKKQQRVNILQRINLSYVYFIFVIWSSSASDWFLWTLFKNERSRLTASTSIFSTTWLISSTSKIISWIRKQCHVSFRWDFSVAVKNLSFLSRHHKRAAEQLAPLDTNQGVGILPAEEYVPAPLNNLFSDGAYRAFDIGRNVGKVNEEISLKKCLKRKVNFMLLLAI